MRYTGRAWLWAVTIALSGCGDSSAHSPVTQYLAVRVDPGISAWRPWVVRDIKMLRPPAPPARDSQQTATELKELAVLAGARSPAILAEIDSWNKGTVRAWNEFERKLIADYPVPPPEAARAYALVSVAMYDAIIAAWDAKLAYGRARPSQHIGAPSVYGIDPATPSFVSERAAVSAAAATVLRFLFPELKFPGIAGKIDRTLESAYSADLFSGIHFRSDVVAGRNLGVAVGAAVVALASEDGATGPAGGYVQESLAGHWTPTAHTSGDTPVRLPVLPHWGRVRTWVLPSADAIRPPPPPPYASPEWQLQAKDVYQVSLSLTAERKAIATKWAGGAGTETPAGQWNRIACDLADAAGLSEPRVARMLAALGVAQHDAFVVCWYCKYSHDCCRPVTEIRKTLDANWTPFLNTPPFPSYPSGHSCVSGAASQLLAHLFPSSASWLATQGSEARDSRLYGGIHFRFDNEAGFDMGRVIANSVIAVLGRDGAG